MAADNVKDRGAVSMGRKRWVGVSDEERKKLMSAAARKRWAKATDEDRARQGALLAKARKKAKSAAKERP